MLSRLLPLVAAVVLTPAWGATLDKADIERAGELCTQAIRPTVILGYQHQSVGLVYGQADRSAGIKLLKNYEGQLELGASYHRVTMDTTNNLELLALAKNLSALRQKEAALCANLSEPNPAADVLGFMGRSAYIGFSEKDHVKAEQLRNDLFINSLMGHLGAQAKVSKDGKDIQELEQACMQLVFSFLEAHPELKNDAKFNGPSRALAAEHAKRGEELAAKLKADPQCLVQSLLGQSSEQLQWTFDADDKVISVKINAQKIFGLCVVSDVTMVAEGQRAGMRTLNFKVAHQANRVGIISVVALK
jgi:hypothetical protein